MTDSTMLVCTALIAFAFVCLMKYVQANMIEARRELQRAEDEIRWLRSEVEALNEGGHRCPTMTHEDPIEDLDADRCHDECPGLVSCLCTRAYGHSGKHEGKFQNGVVTWEVEPQRVELPIAKVHHGR